MPQFFDDYDFRTFAPQRSAIFAEPNFKMRPEHAEWCAFSYKPLLPQRGANFAGSKCALIVPVYCNFTDFGSRIGLANFADSKNA